MKLATAAGDQGLGDSRRQPVVAGGRLLKLRRRRRRKLSLFFSTSFYACSHVVTYGQEIFGLRNESLPELCSCGTLFESTEALTYTG